MSKCPKCGERLFLSWSVASIRLSQCINCHTMIPTVMLEAGQKVLDEGDNEEADA